MCDGKNLSCPRPRVNTGSIVEDLLQWRESALKMLARELRDDDSWESRVAELRVPNSPSGIHLAVLVDPFLQYVLDGSKTIESRFAVRRFAPFGCVRSGDIVLLKAAAGPVVGVCLVSRTWYFQLSGSQIDGIKERFGPAMCADSAFWQSKRAASYATLLEVREPRQLPNPLRCPKRDRRGWVVLRSPQNQLGLTFE